LRRIDLAAIIAIHRAFGGRALAKPAITRMNRRQVLKLGASLGVLGGAGLYGRYVLLPPGPSRQLGSVHDLARDLYDSLEPGPRALACVEYDHPSRQYHNRGVRAAGLEVNRANFSRPQRGILTDLFHAGLSEAGRERMPNEYFLQWFGVHSMNVLICGDPHSPPYQIVLSGPHLNLRLGGRSREGVAFGGPLVYGDQRGNEVQGLPGNVFRYQFQIAHRLFQSLEAGQQRMALQERAPMQTQVELQGSSGAFCGVGIATLSVESRALARELVDGILSSYPPEDVEYAWRCLDANGGLDSLFLSYYADGEVGKSGEYQIFRIEGPCAVFYFRGYPHVHAFVNLAMDGELPLSVGEDLGENPAVIENGAVKRLFEEAMRETTGADLAYYDEESVVGRLRKGRIRAGDIYDLESWQDVVATVEIRGSSLRPALLAELRARGADAVPGRTYRVATTGEVVSELAGEKLGKIEKCERGILLRDATIAHLAAHGFTGRG
jgi:hypothetical protein